MIVNLYEETMIVLKEKGKSLNDIKFIKGDDFDITVDNFIEVAKKTDYDDGYGAAEVAVDLKIVGEDWFLQRREYDGSEWWEYITIPNRTNKIVNIKNLAGDLWHTLKEINEKDE